MEDSPYVTFTVAELLERPDRKGAKMEVPVEIAPEQTEGDKVEGDKVEGDKIEQPQEGDDEGSDE